LDQILLRGYSPLNITRNPITHLPTWQCAVIEFRGRSNYNILSVRVFDNRQPATCMSRKPGPATVSSDGSIHLPQVDLVCERPRLVPTLHWCNWCNASASDMHARRMVLGTHYSPVGVDEGGSEAATARAMRHRYTADATTISAVGAPMV